MNSPTPLVQLRLKGMEVSAVPLLASTHTSSPEPMHDYTLGITVDCKAQPELGKEVRKILSQICCRPDQGIGCEMLSIDKSINLRYIGYTLSNGILQM